MIRVLVVEDSPTLRAILISVLDAEEDIEVVGEAANGREAIKMVADFRPDLVTMDVVMPDMDGIEATRQIMSECPVPILIVTGYIDSLEMNVVFEAMQAGALDVIGKPGLRNEQGIDAWAADFLTKVRTLAHIASGKDSE